MKRTFQIDNHPEKVDTVLSSLRTDNHLSKTFDGTAKNGSLIGFYTNLALINGMVIGYVKIKGQYDREKGNLKLEVVPSNLFWFVISFAVIVISVLTYKGLTGENLFFIGSFLFAFLAFGWTLAFFLEGRSFVRHMHRIVESWL